jgi:metal-responsive CopG/Arc/MetJ family transcriptional regulator
MNTGRILPPIRRVNVDFAAPMLDELDRAAKELNVSRQAVIKVLIRQALDQQLSGDGTPDSRQAPVGRTRFCQPASLR